MEFIYDLDKVLFPCSGENKIWLETFKENVKRRCRSNECSRYVFCCRNKTLPGMGSRLRDVFLL